MKKSLPILLFLITLGGALNNNVQAQVQLRIDSLINFPDTAIIGQAYPVAITVKNVGNTPYQGPLQIALMRDSVFSYLYFSNNPAVAILPNDTLTFYTTLNGMSGFVFDSAVFRPGNNVVVVWPYTNQSMAVDSLTTTVYVDYATGVNEYAIDDGFKLYPNPFSTQLFFSGRYATEIDRVRILTLEGLIVYDNKMVSNSFYTYSLPQGCYLLKAETKDKKFFYRKIFRQ